MQHQNLSRQVFYLKDGDVRIYESARSGYYCGLDVKLLANSTQSRISRGAVLPRIPTLSHTRFFGM